jgi:hypothetical protein
MSEEQTIGSEGVHMSEEKKPDVRIVVLQRGWVAVGRYSKDGAICRLEDSAIIRKWGTTRGLGELRAGPIKNTILDPSGLVEFHELGEIFSIHCETDKWIPFLTK